ncbi:Fur family transcriptional regulator [Desulfopila inferna]|uniref:Fur family transcriptional regulator n=1 Tax=Desulfopila inferna TaxID=468528 RepID=UPI001963E1C0|nr:transcriptional repressor [Desulfopila inferna]MBM9604007.1 transcriptional repressor [Desulfopila inferna]
MCSRCDYTRIIESAGLEPTSKRRRLLEVIGNNGHPLSAVAIFNAIQEFHRINRVTVYRILDLFVENNILERISTGSRAAHYGMGPNENHAPHPHFYCTRCGRLDCLQPESMAVDLEKLKKSFSGEIDRVEVRVDGICKNCLRQEISLKELT